MQIILIFLLIFVAAALAVAFIVTRSALNVAKKQLLAGEQEKAAAENAARAAESAMNAAKVSEAGANARFSELEKAFRDYKENAERAARDSASAVQTLSAKLAAAEEQAQSRQRELDAREKNLAELSQKSRLEFENLANRIFSEKAKEFSGTNETSLKAMLNPLSEKIAEFRNALGETSKSSAKSLAEFSTKFSTEIANMQKMNSELQSDAKGLTTALRRSRAAGAKSCCRKFLKAPGSKTASPSSCRFLIKPGTRRSARTRSFTCRGTSASSSIPRSRSPLTTVP